MLHWPVERNPNCHYAVGFCTHEPVYPGMKFVLLQLGDGKTGEQIRISLNKKETEHIIGLLQENLKNL